MSHYVDLLFIETPKQIQLGLTSGDRSKLTDNSIKSSSPSNQIQIKPLSYKKPGGWLLVTGEVPRGREGWLRCNLITCD